MLEAHRCVYGEKIYQHPEVKTIPERLSGNEQDGPVNTHERVLSPASLPRG